MRNIFLVFFIILFGCKEVTSEKLFSEVISSDEVVKDYFNTNLEALKFCNEKDFNQDYYFLIDMSIHSGKNRFFIHDFKKDSIVASKLATHGSCDKFEDNETKWEKAKFSNKAESHCSSVGKYKIGNRDVSSWGIKVKYWLHGLEQTNNNAVDRVVVLHSWNAVKDEEVYPKYAPLSWGCPAVSNEFMKVLDEKLKQTKKPVLLWIMD